jgi:glycosyltransferase involved in cell wall biosynthesis
MRLFVDAHILDDSFQGSRTYISGLYAEAIRLNSSIEFYFGAYNIENLHNEFGNQPNVHYVKYFTRNKYLRLALNIPFIIIKNKIDVSHFQYVTPIIKLSKEIVTIHDILFLDFPEHFPSSYRFRNKLLFRKSAGRADLLLTVSGYSKERISHYFKIPVEKIHVIPNGVTGAFFDPPDELPDIKTRFNLNKYILLVSRIEPRKNHLLLLKAFTELKLWEKGFQLVFVGEKTMPYPAFEDYLKNLNGKVKHSVMHIDSSFGSELKALYRNCSLFVYPSFAEGFGIPPLEAVASGVPVLCSGTTAMSDFSFLSDSLFDPHSINELKSKIVYNLENKNVNRNADIVRRNYDWKNSALSLMKLFSEL